MTAQANYITDLDIAASIVHVVPVAVVLRIHFGG